MSDPPPWVYPRNLAHVAPLPFPLLPVYSSSPPRNDEEVDAAVEELQASITPPSTGMAGSPTPPTPAPRNLQTWKRAPAGFNCLNCRRKGKKCGGERPACAFCIEKELSCYYQDKHAHLPEYKAAWIEYRNHKYRKPKVEREDTPVTPMETDAEIDSQIAEMVGLDPPKKGRKGTTRKTRRKKTERVLAPTPEDEENEASGGPSPTPPPAATSSVPSKRPAASPLPRRRRVSAPVTQTQYHEASPAANSNAEAGPSTDHRTAVPIAPKLSPPDWPTQPQQTLADYIPRHPPPPSPTEVSELELGPSVVRGSPNLPSNIPDSAPPTEPNDAPAHLPLLPFGVLFPQILGMTPANMPSVQLFKNAEMAPGLAAMAHKFEPQFVPRRMPSMGTPTPAPKDNTLGLSLYPSPQAERHEPPRGTPGPPSEMLRRFPGAPLYVGPALIRPIAHHVPTGIHGPLAYPSFLPNSGWHPAPHLLPNNDYQPPPPLPVAADRFPPSPGPFAFTVPHLPHIPRGNSLHLTDHHVVAGPQVDLQAYDPKEPLSAGWPFTSSLRTSTPH
ncbi:uncharacterized protein LOC62_02G002564 [Vanrija pseudolonga]|uniref:Zn(2)-C6 fungal-type domain-containing protein n=1 Tax=Vanrija pseudolonga TaxID=143232 RepID=A0AAF0Y2V3_9TREE|nr:hypothetical protein LOC62_02G002564 [Vanrija pseudolonga]